MHVRLVFRGTQATAGMSSPSPPSVAASELRIWVADQVEPSSVLREKYNSLSVVPLAQTTRNTPSNEVAILGDFSGCPSVAASLLSVKTDPTVAPPSVDRTANMFWYPAVSAVQTTTTDPFSTGFRVPTIP